MVARAIVLVVLILAGVASAIPQGEESAPDVIPCPSRSWTYAQPSPAALPGARLITGREGGALYIVEIPDQWNGELVIWAHGNVNPDSRGGGALRVQVPALRQHWIEHGFAWAASSYRCNGSVAGVGLMDSMTLRALVPRFTAGREPTRVYLAGVSLGGRTVIMGLSQFPSMFAGGLAECPIGPETYDVRVATAAAAEFLTGVHPTAATIDRDLAQMRAVLGSPGRYTERGRQLASIQIELTGGPRPFAMEGLALRFYDNIRFGVVNAPDAVVRAATNVHVTYRIAEGLGLSSAVLNLRVPRWPADARLRSPSTRPRDTVPFDGLLRRPLLTLQGTGDLQVPVSQQQALKRAVLAAGRSSQLVQRLIRAPGHCQFTRDEQAQAFDDLVAWVRTGIRPDGDDVLGSLLDAGRRFTSVLRAGDPGASDVPASFRAAVPVRRRVPL